MRDTNQLGIRGGSCLPFAAKHEEEPAYIKHVHVDVKAIKTKGNMTGTDTKNSSNVNQHLLMSGLLLTLLIITITFRFFSEARPR